MYNSRNSIGNRKDIFKGMGLKRQALHLKSEAEELIKAIDEWEEAGFSVKGPDSKPYEHAVSEMVDVSSLISQIKENVDGCEDMFGALEEYKICRTLNRIERGFYVKEKENTKDDNKN